MAICDGATIYGYILLAERIYKKQINIKEYCWNFAPGEENCIEVKKFIKLFCKNLNEKPKNCF